MKRFDLSSAVTNSLLSFCLGIAVTGCIGSAFHLSYPDIPELLACLFWAGITCWIFPLKKGWVAIPVGWGIWIVFLWLGNAQEHFGYLLRTYFTTYSMAYGIRVPKSLLQFTGPEVSMALSVIGGIVTMLCGIGLGRLRSGRLAIAACVLPLLPCFVVTDTVPHEAFLCLLMVCVCLILLTQGVRRREPQKVNKLTCMLLVPVLLANICLFQANPQQTYDKQPEELFSEEFWENLFPQWTLPAMTTPTLSIPISLGDVDLQTVGPKQQSKDLAMEVETDLTGVLYLRGKSYAEYRGLSWSAPVFNDDALEVQDGYLAYARYASEWPRLRIRTVLPQNLLYAAYYTPTQVSLRGGAFYNPSMETEYSMRVNPISDGWKTVYWMNNSGMTPALTKEKAYGMDAYLQLSQQTLKDAQKLLKRQGITEDMFVLDAVDAIGNYVRGSARYSLNTDFMPERETDFAMWFLEDSDTGYCVHFATAAAVLLRAAGIPSRFVEGYVTRIDFEGTARVTEDQAHAWVEYWLPELGWVILEATPEEGWTPPPPTEPTQPVTRPTQPTIPTEPTQLPTRPTGPTEPSQTRPTEVPTVPATTAPGTDPLEPPSRDLTWMWIWLQKLLVVILVIAAVVGQWRLRLYLRRLWMRKGDPNVQALRRWRWSKQLAKLRRQDVPEALMELALKAKFSQHTISAEELAMFDGYFIRSQEHLQTKIWPLRWLYRVIFAVY